MQFQNSWIYVFFLAALAAMIAAAPIGTSNGVVARQALAATPTYTNATVSTASSDDDDFDYDAYWRRDSIAGRSELGAIVDVGEDAAKIASKIKPGTAAKAAEDVEAPAAKAIKAVKTKNPLPSSQVSNSKINKLKDADTLFFSGSKDAAGTAKVKAFAKSHNLKTIDDAFPPGTFSNFNQFAGTKDEKTKFLEDASANFAKAVKPGAGKVFAAVPSEGASAEGIFSRIEAPALKANGHTALTKLDIDNLDKIADPHSIEDALHL